MNILTNILDYILLFSSAMKCRTCIVLIFAPVCSVKSLHDKRAKQAEGEEQIVQCKIGEDSCFPEHIVAIR